MDKIALTKIALARALGISRQAVFRYEKEGMPCATIELAKAWRDANVQPRINATEAATMDAPTASPKGKAESAARHRRGEGAGSDRLYWLSRGRREQAEAAIAEMREAELRGTFINKAGAERAISTAFRLLRDAILGVPDRLPIEHAQRIEFRRALEAAFSDAEKMMAPNALAAALGVARGRAEDATNR